MKEISEHLKMKYDRTIRKRRNIYMWMRERGRYSVYTCASVHVFVILFVCLFPQQREDKQSRYGKVVLLLMKVWERGKKKDFASSIETEVCTSESHRDMIWGMAARRHTGRGEHLQQYQASSLFGTPSIGGSLTRRPYEDGDGRER